MQVLPVAVDVPGLVIVVIVGCCDGSSMVIHGHGASVILKKRL